MKNIRHAFTMAEILLSLTIIGVVAAITLPSLTGNINERTWNTQRKALYARMSQAISLMPSLNGYGTLSLGEDDSGSTSIIEDNTAEILITNGLSKVLKINNVCDNEHLKDCGINPNINNILGSKMDFPKTMKEWNSTIRNSFWDSYSFNSKAAAFETANGESVAVFYNYRCSNMTLVNSPGTSMYLTDSMCINFIYDLNGTKGPNTVGKDIGYMTVFNPIDSLVVAPQSLGKNSVHSSSNYTFDMVPGACKDDTRLPNIHELLSMYFNKELIDLNANANYMWSSSVFTVNGVKYRWIFNFHNRYRIDPVSSGSNALRCIKR